jgi:hypothetical protein
LQILGLCMDNAGNCNRMANLLPNYAPHFLGKRWRLRCLCHIVNLIAKVFNLSLKLFQNKLLIVRFKIFICFFFKKPKVKKSVQVESGDRIDEIVLDAGNEDEGGEDEVVTEEASLDAQASQGDEGQIAHDDEVVKSVRDRAIVDMRRKGVRMSSGEEKMAQKIFPMVSAPSFIFIFNVQVLLHRLQDLPERSMTHLH